MPEKACFISMHKPQEIDTLPWMLTGEWCWQRAYKADVLNPRAVRRDWGVLDQYGLILVPGYVQTFRFLREMMAVRPRGRVVAWIDYSAALMSMLPAVQHDPTLPAAVGLADVVIMPDPEHAPYIGDTATIAQMVHPVDGERLQKHLKPQLLEKRPTVGGKQVCVWVFHRWPPANWVTPAMMTERRPDLYHIAVGLSQEAVEWGLMHFDEAYQTISTKDLCTLISKSHCVVDMNPYRSMGRVVLEAASLGTPVYVNRFPTCSVPTRKWYCGIECDAEYAQEQGDAVKQHWIEPSKKRLDSYLGL